MVWPEDRIRPIRMTHTLPLLWVAAGAAPATSSEEEASSSGEGFKVCQDFSHPPRRSRR